MPRLLLAVVITLYANVLQAAPLTLAECLTAAQEANPSLRVTHHDEAIARHGITLAKSGNLPRIDTQAGGVFQLEPQAVKFGPLTQETQEADYAFLGLAITQTLYDFGRTRSRTGQAEQLTAAASEQFRAARQDIFLRVVQGYFGILREQKLLKAAEDEVRQREAHVKNVAALFAAGSITRNDQLQAEVRLAGSRQNRMATANRLATGWLTLNYLTGRPVTFRAELVDDFPAEPVETAALDSRQRPELRAQEKTVAASELAVAESSSAFYPELFAKLALDYVQNDRVREQAIYSATLGLKVNIYDGGVKTAREQQAQEQLRREQDRLRALEAVLALELATAANDLQVARERIGVTEKAIGQAEENLRITNDRYLALVGTATEVIDAQTMLSQARAEYHQATYDYRVAAARLKHAAGAL